jgi:hypothetical protein
MNCFASNADRSTSMRARSPSIQAQPRTAKAARSTCQLKRSLPLKVGDESTRALEREQGVIVRHVFHRHGEPVREFPYDLWHGAVSKAGIPGRRIIHDFRRTAARSYRRSGVSEGVVMMIGGWKTRSIFERCNINNEQDLREAAIAVANEMGRNGHVRAKVTILTPGTKEKSQ